MRTDFERFLRAAASKREYAFSLACFGVLAFACWGYSVDDAFIVARYARNLAQGRGWTFDGESRTDGVTGPLALLLPSALSLLGIDPLAASKTIGLLATAMAIIVTLHQAHRRALGRRAILFAALMLSSRIDLAVWSIAGLETGLATLLATLAARSAIARPRSASVSLGCTIGALFWLRPEMSFFSFVLLVSAALRCRRSGKVASAIAAGWALSLLLFRIVWFGDPLPLSFYAKPGVFEHGVTYLIGSSPFVFAFGALILMIAPAWQSRSLRPLVFAIGAHACALLVAGGDWMPGHRLWIPVIPSLAFVAAHGLSRLALRRPLLSAILLGVTLLSNATMLAVDGPRIREAAFTQATRGGAFAAMLARTSDDGRVALVDVGRVAYENNLRVLDLAGVVDPAIAHLPGEHLAKAMAPSVLLERDVSIVVLRSYAEPRLTADGGFVLPKTSPLEQRLATSELVRAHYRVRQVYVYSAELWYVVLVRRRRIEARHPTLDSGRLIE